MSTPPSFHLLAAAITALAVGIIDYRSGRMPNALTLTSMLLALLVKFATGGVDGLLLGSVGLLVAGGVPALLFFTTGGKAIGGGDVKALAALGAWLGPMAGLEVELLAFVLLAGFSLGRETLRGAFLPLLSRSLSFALPRSFTRSPPRETTMTFVRFGPFLAAATLVSCGAAELSSAGRMLWALT